MMFKLPHNIEIEWKLPNTFYEYSIIPITNSSKEMTKEIHRKIHFMSTLVKILNEIIVNGIL
jgi:hypothetical protein